MARPKGQRAGELDVEKAQEYPRRIFERAARSVASELEEYIKFRCSRINFKGKNPSKPGQYPKVVTGDFLGGIRVLYSRENNSLRVYSEMPYGKYLEGKTPETGGRPWASRALEARDWMARIAKVAKSLSK